MRDNKPIDNPARPPAEDMLASVSLRQLQALVSVGQTASFTVAAEQLGLSQPSVSHLIRRLEHQLGQPLVVRGRDVRLTSAGAHLADVARRSLLTIGTALIESRNQAALRSGSVSVAVGHISAAILLPLVLTRFKREHPNIELTITDCMAHEVKGKILSHEVDLGVAAVSSLHDSQITTEDIFDSRMALFMRQDSALAAMSAIDATLLAELPCIQLNPNAPHWLNISRELLARNIYPRIEQRVTLLSTAVGMIHAGMGVAVLPGFVESQMPGSIRSVRIENPELHWPVTIIRQAKYPASPAARAFMQTVRLEARALYRRANEQPPGSGEAT
jgi:DNA-binding transcriptional LysR family regulator